MKVEWLIMVMVALQWSYTNSTSYSFLVFAPKGTCQVDTVPGKLSLVDLSDCSKLGGEIVDVKGKQHCKMDICTDIGPYEYIAKGDVWTVSPEDIAKNMPANDKVMINIQARREECELLTGRPHLELTDDPFAVNLPYVKAIDCQVTLVRRPGTSKKELTDVLPFAGLGKCLSAATGGALMKAKPSECTNLGGQINFREHILNTTLNQYQIQAMDMQGDFGCYFHLCLSTAVDCTATEQNEIHQACGMSVELADAIQPEPTIECSWELQQGLTHRRSSTSTTGGSNSKEFSAEVKMSLMDIFSVSAGANTGLSSYWSDAAMHDDIWSSSTYIKKTARVKPGTKVLIKQLVGVCGGYRVATPRYETEIVDLKTGNPCDED